MRLKNDLLLCGHLRIIRILPFEVKIPSARPVDISALSEAEFHEELEKGYADEMCIRDRYCEEQSEAAISEQEEHDETVQRINQRRTCAA